MLIRYGTKLLRRYGKLARSIACCCGAIDICCNDCTWLSNYLVALGKFKFAFVSGPITGYNIMEVTSADAPNACLAWDSVALGSTVIDCDSLGAVGNGSFWCELTGSSDKPLKATISLGNGGCEVLPVGDQPELVECTPPEEGEEFGTLLIRLRYVLNDLFAGGCDACGGEGTEIVIEITRFP